MSYWNTQLHPRCTRSPKIICEIRVCSVLNSLDFPVVMFAAQSNVWSHKRPCLYRHRKMTNCSKLIINRKLRSGIRKRASEHPLWQRTGSIFRFRMDQGVRIDLIRDLGFTLCLYLHEKKMIESMPFFSCILYHWESLVGRSGHLGNLVGLVFWVFRYRVSKQIRLVVSPATSQSAYQLTSRS